MTELVLVEGQVVDPTTSPATCELCSAPTLLRPVGLCAACVAATGLADDQADYVARRERVSEQVYRG